MEQDRRARDREREKARADAILKVPLPHPVTGAVWDRAEVAAAVKAKDEAADRVAAGDHNFNPIKP
jgi:hypothetical protein